jgi:hypothetical protein
MRCKVTGKVKHKTKEGGIIATKKKSKVLYNVYYCKSCKGYHLGRTSSPYRNTLRIIEILTRYNKVNEQHQKIYREYQSTI